MPQKEHQGLRPLFVAFGVLLAAFASAIRIFDADTWFHLASGRLILESGLPASNTFSFTFPDHPWQDLEWLFDVLTYSSFHIGGFPALVLLQMALVAGTFALICASALDKVKAPSRASLLLSLPVLVLALSAIRFRFPLRPHLITFAGIALLLYLWGRQPKRLPLWFAFAGAVWSNFHPGVVIGLAVCLILLFSCLLGKDIRSARTCALACLAFFAGSLLNPYLLSPYSYTLPCLDFEKVFPGILEMGPADPGRFPAFALLGLMGLLSIPLAWTRGDRGHVLLTGAFLLLAMRSNREIGDFVIVTLPGLLASLHQAIDRLAGRRLRIPALAVLSAFLVSAAGIAGAWEYRAYQWILTPGFGINDKVVPSGAADFLEAQGIRGNMYNSVGFGGFLIWRFYPERGVFMDGRTFAYPIGFLREVSGRTRKLTPGIWADLMARYRSDYAVVDRIPYSDNPNVSLLFETLGWPLVYIDGISCVFVNPSSGNAAAALRAGFRLVGVNTNAVELNTAGRMHPDKMIRDLSRINPDRLLDPIDCHRFGMAALGAGDNALAQGFFRKGLELEPSGTTLSRLLRDYLRKLGTREN